ncbi:MAG: hypothetical protein HYX78_03080 [Armatimonadetes bacterium]|nr:hypothetical protein [Armatimonadota bacterium]
MRTNALLSIAAMCLLTIPQFAQSANIIIPFDATPKEQLAGEELASYARKITGQVYPVVHKATPDKGFVISRLGSCLWTSLPMRVRSEANHMAGTPDAFVVMSDKGRSGTRIYLIGASDSACLYAVYAYLEQVCGVGFFLDGERVPKLRHLPMSSIEIMEKPRFKYRGMSAWVGHRGLTKYCPSMWDLARWQKFLSWCAKKRFNQIAGYDMCWYSYVAGDLLQQAFPGDYSAPKPGPQPNFDTSKIDDFENAWIFPQVSQRKISQQALKFGRERGIQFPYTITYAEVLPEYHDKYPELKYMTHGQGFENEQKALTYLMDPSQRAAADYAAREYSAISKLFGTDHLWRFEPYSAELPEGGDPYKAKIDASKNMLEVLKSVDPQRKWVLTTWDIRHAGWPIEKARAYLKAIPDNAYFPIICHSYAEAAKYDYFWGREWGFCHLASLAQDPLPHGDFEWPLDQVRMIEQNPNASRCVTYWQGSEIVSDPLESAWQAEIAWHGANASLQHFLSYYAERRYGKASLPNMLKSLQEQIKARKLIMFYSEMEDQLYFSGKPEDEFVFRYNWGFSRHISFWPWPGIKVEQSKKRREILDETIRHFRAAIDLAALERKRQLDNPLYENDIVEMTITYLGEMCQREWLDMLLASEEARSRLARGQDAKPDIERMERHADATDSAFKLTIQFLSSKPEYSLQGTIDRVMSTPGANSYSPTMLRRFTVAFQGYQSHPIYELFVQVYRPRFLAYAGALKRKIEQKSKEPLSAEDPELKSALYDIQRRWVLEPAPVERRPARLDWSIVDAAVGLH